MLRKHWSRGLSAGLITVLSLTAMMLAAPADSPVADAAMSGDLEVVRGLLRGGADVNAAQGDGLTALHWAALNDNVELAEMLLYAGGNVRAATRINAITPIFMASRNGSAAMLRTLIGAGADANAEMPTGTTPLMMASESGSTEAVAVLIEAGADLDATETQFGQTPLIFAAALNRHEVLEVLLDHGADPNINTKVVDLSTRNSRRGARGRGGRGAPAARGRRGFPGRGGAPAAEAEESSNATLLSASGIPISAGQGSVTRPRTGRAAPGSPQNNQFGRRPSVQFQGGLTPLLYAAREGHFESVDVLLDAGVDINAVGPGEKTSPLMIAVVNGHFDLAMHLLEKDADPTLANIAGGTPLYATLNVKWAPEAGYPQPDSTQNATSYLGLVQALIDHGADVNARLTNGLWFTGYNFDLARASTVGATPFWRAAQVNDVAGMKLLIDNGADPHIKTDANVGPLQIASGAGVHGNDEITAPGGWMPGVRYLVEEIGLDVNDADDTGYTALHNAAARGDNEMILLLVSHGAKVDPISSRGQTVADMANGPRQRIQPFPETIALLLSLGSPFNDNCVSC